ncbi:MAG: maleylpyruvate isomerase family mycothiol-dependent enzyme, partial [Ilumatobacteraceae bacterium]
MGEGVMDGPAAVWQQAAEFFDRNVTSLDDEQVGRASPCGEWTVGDVVDHAVSSQAGIASILGAEVSAADGWPAVRDAMAATLADPSNLVGDTPSEVMGGMPKHQLLGIAIGDALLHGWDVARATGGDENMPPAAVEAVLMGLQ